MSPTDVSPNLTQLLVHFNNGDRDAIDSLLPAVYKELRRLAASYLRRESSGHTLQPTALVHEAYFRLIDQKAVQWENRSQFFGVAAQLMRRILIDHARARHAAKRGGMSGKLPFDEAIHWSEQEVTPDLLTLDEALGKLKLLNERQEKVVELKYFGGLNIDEIAEVLSISPATVKRDWTLAKAWLFRELGSAAGEPGEST